ncbi:MAG: 30S ribosomal protein S1 [Candidatus Omnitrophica bacterium]|nr:30S ribosomal protein S1 [Candidatus Omnitrophota bacterium]MBU1871883.1 30S ribosomal protein S1 [Candidatus Omnitrophota bacterium]
MSEEKVLNLEELYNQSIKKISDGQIVIGKIVAIKAKEVLVDIGFKSEGIVAASEFNPQDLEIGKELDFFIESIENDAGMILLSHTRAKQMQGWNRIVADHNSGNLIEGSVQKKVKGGFLVDIEGVEGFLPGSLSGFRDMPEKEIVNKAFKFKVTKLNNFRRSIIVSRREAVQKERQQARQVIWEKIKIGEVASGIVKAITDFGAFIDLGGVDGLLHITDMSWSRVSHPSEVVAVGDRLEVMVLNIDKEANKIALGLKQRLSDPWENIADKYPIGSRIKGKVVNILPYGIFVEIEKGIEGLVHISEISWAKRVDNLSSTFAIGDVIEIQVLSVDPQNRKIALSVKQLEINPWLDVEAKYSAGSRITGRVRGFTDYGAFVELDNNIEGMIHISDLSWTKRISHPQDVLKKGQKVEVVILSVEGNNRRISLGLKQLQPNPWTDIAERYPLESILEVEVISITEFGVFVKLEEELEGLIFSSEIEPAQLSELKPADKLKVKVIKVDVEQAKIGLSTKL